MKAFDFEYDGIKLSSFGMIICSFDEKGVETIDNGNKITLNTVSTLGGSKRKLTSTTYDDCLEHTIQICKYSCSSDIQEITEIEFRQITSWLQRKKFLKLKFLDKEHIDLYYNASFTKIDKIEIDGKLMGLELNIETSSPHAFKEPRIITIKNLVSNGKHSINDTSYEEGYIYPYMEITINESGNLKIYNARENRETIINNCVVGEIITMNYPIIESSNSSRNIQNDFNYKFFRLANTYDNSRNDLTISIPCTIKIKYSPIVKVGL